MRLHFNNHFNSCDKECTYFVHEPKVAVFTDLPWAVWPVYGAVVVGHYSTITDYVEHTKRCIHQLLVWSACNSNHHRTWSNRRPMTHSDLVGKIINSIIFFLLKTSHSRLERCNRPLCIQHIKSSFFSFLLYIWIVKLGCGYWIPLLWYPLIMLPGAGSTSDTSISACQMSRCNNSYNAKHCHEHC